MNYLKASMIALLGLLITLPAHANMDRNPNPQPDPILPVSPLDNPWDLQFAWNLEAQEQSASNLGCEFAGGFIWISGGSSTAGGLDPRLYKYNTTGVLVDSVIVPGGTGLQWGLRDLCNDGTYIYGSWNTTVQAFDAVTGVAAPTANIDVTALTGINPARALAYDPESDQFFTANFGSTIYRFNRSGIAVASWANTLSIYGLAWWADDPDGYQLYMFSQNGTPQTQVTKLNVNTGATMVVQPSLPNQVVLSGIAGGCFIARNLIPNKVVFGALVQGDPDYLQTYELTTYTEGGIAGGYVTPNYGIPSTNFTYRTLYTDATNTAPDSIFVVIDGVRYPMVFASGTIATGAWYQYASVLTAGVHNYSFVCYRGGTTTTAPGTGTFDGPSVYAPFTGTKTIGGTNPDFATFSAAISVLQVAGVGEGGVTFLVRAGAYNERVTIGEIPGASATNPVVFQPEGGTVTVTANGSTSTGEWIIKLNGCDYVTFDGINVQELGTGTAINEYGYWVTNISATNGATNNAIRNATITMYHGSSTTRGIYSTRAFTASAQSGTNSDNKYINLKISGPAYGVYLSGSSAWRDLNTEIGSTSSDLNFAGRFEVGSGGVDDIGGGAFAAYGMYCLYQENLTVHNLDIHNVSTNGVTGAYTAYGLYCSSFYGTANIYGNRIHTIQSRTAYTSNGNAYGMYLSGAASHSARVYDNFIWGMTSSSNRTTVTSTHYAHGIYTTGSTSNFFLDFNSILINSGTINPTADLLYSSNCLYLSSGLVTARNNILYNKTAEQTGTSKHYGIYRSSATLTSNNNCFYIPNTANGFVGYYAGDRATLANWQAALAGMDANSQYGDPRYMDDTGTDLHISLNVETPVSNAGTSVGWVVGDIENTARDAIPDIGADEGIFGITDPCAPSNPVVLASYSDGLRVQWQGQCDTDSLYRFDLSTDGVNFTTHSTVLSAGGIAPRIQAADLIGLSPAVQYFIRFYSLSTSNVSSTTIVQTNGYTLPLTAGAVYLSLTGSGYSTAKVDSIGPDGNPASVNYRVRELTTGNYVAAGGVLGAVPRASNRAGWLDYPVNGLLNGTQYQFVAIPVNGGGGVGAQGTTFNITTNAFLATGGPDSSGYIFRTNSAVNGPVYSWVDPGTTTLAISGDEATGWINFGGFHFPFYGQTYDSVLASTNCYLMFQTANNQWQNAAVPASIVGVPAVFPLWDDGNFLTTNCITYRNVGDGRFVVTYTNVPHFDDNAALATFQVVFYDDGRILFQYQNVANFWTATIGIQGTGLTGSTNGLMFGEPYIYPSPQSAILFYPFTPTAPNPPVVSISRINADIVLNWTPSTGGQLHGYKIYSSETPYFSIGGLTPVGTVDAATNTWTDFLAYETGIRYYLVTGYNNYTADSYRPFANEPLRYDTSFHRGTGPRVSKKPNTIIRSID